MLKLVVSIWYLVNNGWVKNVNKLRLIGSTSSVDMSTKKYNSLYKQVGIGVQTQLINFSLLHYSTKIYTYLNLKFNLLNKSFTYYPHNLLMSLLKEN